MYVMVFESIIGDLFFKCCDTADTEEECINKFIDHSTDGEWREHTIYMIKPIGKNTNMTIYSRPLVEIVRKIVVSVSINIKKK